MHAFILLLVGSFMGGSFFVQPYPRATGNIVDRMINPTIGQPCLISLGYDEHLLRPSLEPTLERNNILQRLHEQLKAIDMQNTPTSQTPAFSTFMDVDEGVEVVDGWYAMLDDDDVRILLEDNDQAKFHVRPLNETFTLSHQLERRDDGDSCPYVWQVGATAAISTLATSWASISLSTSGTGTSTTIGVTSSVQSAIEVLTAKETTPTAASNILTWTTAPAPVVASTVAGNPVKETELCQQQCTSGFGFCSTVPSASFQRRNENIMDCGAVANCYCTTVPFIDGSSNIDMTRAIETCENTCQGVDSGTQLFANGGTVYTYEELWQCLEQAQLPDAPQPAGCMGA